MSISCSGDIVSAFAILVFVSSFSYSSRPQVDFASRRLIDGSKCIAIAVGLPIYVPLKMGYQGFDNISGPSPEFSKVLFDYPI